LKKSFSKIDHLIQIGFEAGHTLLIAEPIDFLGCGEAGAFPVFCGFRSDFLSFVTVKYFCPPLKISV
jgi:hypothetical protein